MSLETMEVASERMDEVSTPSRLTFVERFRQGIPCPSEPPPPLHPPLSSPSPQTLTPAISFQAPIPEIPHLQIPQMLSMLQHPAAAAVVPLLGGGLLSVASTKLVPRKLRYLAAEFHTLPELIERVKRLLRYVGLHLPLIDFLTKA
ncbi:hypothetical protein L484_009493 [Morus notabilis]|uniref:Uncharacterized protein n=1 Tax=Morus notabilis TaxID=981085 RepID=W9QX58_9ROSA|nr:hypothetical protein L484_009493 [Morus notabilis]